jgi:hypothetical protein
MAPVNPAHVLVASWNLSTVGATSCSATEDDAVIAGCQ